MARLRFDQDDVDCYDPPKVCAVCGQPADHVIQKKFRWNPEWVMALIVVGALVFHILAIVGVVLAFTMAKSMTIPMPVCNRHTGYWTRRLFWIYGPVSLL